MIAAYWSPLDIVSAWVTAIVILLVLAFLAFDLIGFFSRLASRGRGVDQARIDATVNQMFADNLHVHVDPNAAPPINQAAPWNQIVDHLKGH